MQTSYSINQSAGRPGAIADSAMVQDIETYKNPAGIVLFGHLVVRGADTESIIPPAAAASITDEKLVRGIVVASHEMESNRDGLLPNYVANSVVPVMRKGRIWVQSESAITEGTSTVNARFAVGAGSRLGALRGAADSTFTAVVPKAKWKSSTGGTEQLAVLEIDL